MTLYRFLLMAIIWHTGQVQAQTNPLDTTDRDVSISRKMSREEIHQALTQRKSGRLEDYFLADSSLEDARDRKIRNEIADKWWHEAGYIRLRNSKSFDDKNQNEAIFGLSAIIGGELRLAGVVAVIDENDWDDILELRELYLEKHLATNHRLSAGRLDINRSHPFKYVDGVRLSGEFNQAVIDTYKITLAGLPDQGDHYGHYGEIIVARKSLLNTLMGIGAEVVFHDEYGIFVAERELLRAFNVLFEASVHLKSLAQRYDLAVVAHLDQLDISIRHIYTSHVKNYGKRDALVTQYGGHSAILGVKWAPHGNYSALISTLKYRLENRDLYPISKLWYQGRLFLARQLHANRNKNLFFLGEVGYNFSERLNSPEDLFWSLNLERRFGKTFHNPIKNTKKANLLGRSWQN